MPGVDIYDIRRRNLERKLAEFHTLAELAKASNVSAIYLTQVLSDRTRRHMGDKVARRIEDKLELPAGWMDSLETPATNLSTDALIVAQKFDRLPERVQARIAADIDALYRYNADK